MIILSAAGLMLLKLAMNILLPRQWVLQQTISDSYMTAEKAKAQRIPFDEISVTNSPYPLGSVAETEVEIGKLPGLGTTQGVPVKGTLRRTRILLEGTEATNAKPNPANMEVWKLQSVLTYEIGNRTYSKSRTVVRSQ